MTTSLPPEFTLKETLFSAARVRHIAVELQAVYPAFDKKRFLREALPTLASLTLMQRLRHVTERVHACLPMPYGKALRVLYELAPRLDNAFVCMVLSDFVALYGAKHFATSMAALAYFTRFGSSEFAVRHFLRTDLKKTLAMMVRWSTDENEHVRRLASEGCRPRLPWSFRIEPLIADPTPVAGILENLRCDPSLYVRKSVANHLNDISKDHPDWVLERVAAWPLDDVRTAWVVRHGLRTLIKRGDRTALALLGADSEASVELTKLSVKPSKIRLGDSVTLGFELRSTGAQRQKLVVDYAIHYVRPGRTSLGSRARKRASTRKVFKLKTLELGPGARELVSRKQTIRDFSTRTHYAGKHEVEILVNGQVLGRASFTLCD
jgi:3-methyladenine DNA glycosylase AlkC